MTLEEYLWENRISILQFAVMINVAQATAYRLVHHDGCKTAHASTLRKIEDATGGRVTYKEMRGSDDKKRPKRPADNATSG